MNNDNLSADFYKFLALLLKNQGSRKIPLNYHQIDLRGASFWSKSKSNSFEAKLGDFVCDVMDNSKMYFTNTQGEPISYPGLYARYVMNGQYIDLRIDTNSGDSSMQAKVVSIMSALSQSPRFNLPLIGLDQVDPDGGHYYRFSLVQAKPVKLNINELRQLPYDQLKLSDNFVINYTTEPHLLLSGGTGSGKTYSLELLLAEMIQKIKTIGYREGAVYVADPKYSDLANFASIIGVTKVAQSAAQICGMLREAVTSMNKRYKSMPKNQSTIGKTAINFDFAPIFIIIDEFSALLASLKSTKNGKKIAEEINGYLTEIIQKGRQANCFLVLAMQRASTDSGLSSDIRYNFATKVILGNADPTTVAMIFGSQKNYQLTRIECAGGGYYIKNDGLQPQKFFTYTYSLNDLINQTINPNKPFNFYKSYKKACEITDRLPTRIALNTDNVSLQKLLIYLEEHGPIEFKNDFLQALKFARKKDYMQVHRHLDKVFDDHQKYWENTKLNY